MRVVSRKGKTMKSLKHSITEAGEARESKPAMTYYHATKQVCFCLIFLHNFIGASGALDNSKTAQIGGVKATLLQVLDDEAEGFFFTNGGAGCRAIGKLTALPNAGV